MVVIASFQNGDNDYGCIQMKLNLKDCDASQCDELKHINHFPGAYRNTADSVGGTFDVAHKGIIIALIQKVGSKHYAFALSNLRM